MILRLFCIHIVLWVFLACIGDAKGFAASGSVVKDSGETEYVRSQPIALNYSREDAQAGYVHGWFSAREYRAAFYALSEFYPSGKDCLLFAVSFFKHVIPPFLVVVALFVLSATRRLSPIFCHRSERQEILGTLKVLMIVFLVVILLPHFAFNPFAPHYFEKVCISVYLHDWQVGGSLRYFLPSGISLVIIPIYYMKKNAVSIESLFTFDTKKLRAILLYSFMGVFGLVLCYFAVYIISLLAGSGGAAESGEMNMQNPNLYYVLPLGILSTIFDSVIAPFMEEICHRGMVLSLLKKHFKSHVSIIFSALFFASLPFHLATLPAMITAFGGGILLAFVVHKTNSLWPAIFLHAIWNSSYLLYYLI